MNILRKFIPVLCVVAVVFVSSGFTLPRTDKTLTVKADDKTFYYSYPQIDEYKGEYYLKDLDGVVEDIYYSTKIKPVDATAKLDKNSNGKFIYTSEKTGKEIDKSELKDKILSALNDGVNEVEVFSHVVYPEVTVTDLKQRTCKRGSFSTSYVTSTDERKHNIGLACKSINGEVIRSGEIFSFNATVGNRTEARGYKTAKIISEGKFTDGVGGGVCQVSTTVYNSALLSGLEIVEYKRHTLAVSYVEVGFDAMVSDGYSDLKIKNVTPYDIYIECKADGNDVTVTFYGEKDLYTYKRISETVEIIPPPEDKTVYVIDLPHGETRVTAYPKNGLKTVSYLKTYLDGELVEVKRIRSDVYKSVGKVIEKGV